MPSGADRWAELSSQNERVVQAGDSEHSSSSGGARSGWDDLASQRERVVDVADPMFRRDQAYHGPAGMRLVAGAA
jgi:hypothetical protein